MVRRDSATQLLAKLKAAEEQARGHSWHVEFGRGRRCILDSATGQTQELIDEQAFLRTHNSKMRAIVDVWDALPRIIDVLEHRIK